MIRKAFFYIIFISITDGGSINILHERKTLRIRHAEIDAAKCGQPFWKKSREALADHMTGKEVQIVEIDIDQ